MTIAEQIAAKEAELEQARQGLQAAADQRPYGSMRTKSFGVRADANLRRGGQFARAIQRLERELEGLRRRSTQPEPKPVDLDRLPYARFVRTWNGWHKVVKVNRVTVKVVVSPGWDDLIKVSKILEIREHEADTSSGNVTPDHTDPS